MPYAPAALPPIGRRVARADHHRDRSRSAFGMCSSRRQPRWDLEGTTMNAIICEAEALRRDLRRRRPEVAVRGVVVTYPVGHATVHRGSLHRGHMTKEQM